MSQVELSRVISDLTHKQTSIYTPIEEAVVNGIDAIKLAKKQGGAYQGKIIITLHRGSTAQGLGDMDDSIPEIIGVDITDNGIGFNEANTTSFDTYLSPFKMKVGGKGFGRFTYLKYFSDVSFSSTYKGDDGYHRLSFEFPQSGTNFFKNKKDESLGGDKRQTGTTVHLSNMKKTNRTGFDKGTRVFARKLFEKLLIYFLDEECPSIEIHDTGKPIITINDFINADNDIQKISDEKLSIDYGEGESESFHLHLFKVYHSTTKSSTIDLVAHNRAVTQTMMHSIVPELREQLIDVVEGKRKKDVSKGYTLKAYVTGDYLDTHVNQERSGFHFPECETDNGGIMLCYPISKDYIDYTVISYIKDKFADIISTRYEEKVKQIHQYVNEEAYRHKNYIDEIDLSDIPFGRGKKDLEMDLLGKRYDLEMDTRRDLQIKLGSIEGLEESISEEVSSLMTTITNLHKGDLAHYVATRKIILKIYSTILERDDDKKYSKEDQIHKIFFPTKKDSDDVGANHNLWIVDEKLSFHEFVTSDKYLKDRKRPDIALFDTKIVYREGDEKHNPISVFEFKRPGGSSHDKKNPIQQIANYIKSIRDGNLKDAKGRKIKISKDTQAFGYLICDLTDEIRDACGLLYPMPDGEGYYGRHPQAEAYIEVKSFEKVLHDSQERNRVFFHKLGMS